MLSAMRQAIPALLLTVTVCLAACSGEAKPAQPVSYYLEHEAERTQMLAKCREDVKRAQSDGECLNARAAQSQRLAVELREAGQRIEAERDAEGERMKKELLENMAKTKQRKIEPQGSGK